MSQTSRKSIKLNRLDEEEENNNIPTSTSEEDEEYKNTTSTSEEDKTTSESENLTDEDEDIDITTSEEEEEEDEDIDEDEEDEKDRLLDSPQENKKSIQNKFSPNNLIINFKPHKLNIIEAYKQLINLLKKYYYNKNEDGGKKMELKTNQRVNTPGGLFIIPDEEYDNFLELYASIVENPIFINNDINKYEKYKMNFGECQCSTGPLSLDFDMSYKKILYDVERIYYTNDFINKVIDIIESIIKTYYNLKGHKLISLLFEKPTPTKIEKEIKDENGNIKKEITFKDGFHVLIDLPFKKEDRHFIYSKALNEMIISGVFDNIPTEDLPQTIFDESTISRNCWMMYNSTKIISEIKQGKKTDKIYIRPSYNLTQTREPYTLTSIKQLSIRKYKDVEPLEVKDEIYDKYMIDINNYKTLNNDQINKVKSPTTLNLNHKEINKLSEVINTINKINDFSDYKFTSEELERIEWARKLIKLINPKRADNYADWLYIIWGLHNTHTSLYPEALEFSKQSPKYDENAVHNAWQLCKGQGKVCGLHTLENYALRDNEKEYNNCYIDIHANIIEKALDGTPNKISMIPYTKFGSLFFATPEKKATKTSLIVYYFNGKRWVIDQNGRKSIIAIQRCQHLIEKLKTKYIQDYLMITDKYLNDKKEKLKKDNDLEIDNINKERNKKVEEIEKEYLKKINALNKKINENTNTSKYSKVRDDLVLELDAEKEKINNEYKNILKDQEKKFKKELKDLEKTKISKKEYQSKINKYQKVINALDSITDINNNIYKQFCNKILMSYDKFHNKVNQNQNLIGVKNGVIDFNVNYLKGEKPIFREGCPNDYITLSMGCKYDPTLTWESEYVKKFLDYIYSLQLKKENADCLLRVLASCLDGYNRYNNIFFFQGRGRNGKSELMNFISRLFSPDYCINANYAILTQKSKANSNASPDIYRFMEKRIIIMDEGDNTETIQAATLKKLSGGDQIVARPLYGSEIQFTPQFIIFIICNLMSKINSNDYGTNRRICKFMFDVNFISLNKKKIEEFAYNERPANFEIIESLKSDKMLEAALWVLVQYYIDYRLNGGYQFTEDINNATDEYKIESNTYAQFLKYFYLEDKQNINKEGININNVYKEYKKYCLNNDIVNKINKNEFIKQLEVLSSNDDIMKFSIEHIGKDIIIKGLIPYNTENYNSETSINSNYSNTTTPNFNLEELNESFDTKSENLNKQKKIKNDFNKDSKSESNIKLN